MKIEIPDLTGAECGDIAITAAEGGIGYWSQIDKYDWRRWMIDPEDSSKGNAEVADDFVFYTIRTDLEDDGTYTGQPIDITPRLIRLGFERMMAVPVKRDETGWEIAGHLVSVPREDWTGEIDSIGADIIIQLGAFGEVVWG